MKKIFLLLICLFHSPAQGLIPTRVILGCDTNPEYLQFWPVVAHAWQNIIGIRPTLAFIAPLTTVIDESLGDVVRFEPIQGVSTALYAQCIRLLLPAMFPDDICIISDMDMIPLQKKYFIDSVEHIPEDHMVVYRSQAILEYKQFPMCYVAGKGSLFQEIFNLNSLENIPSVIQAWAQMRKGWSTDQELLYSYLTTWNKFKLQCDLLNLSIKRIDRSNWKYNEALLAQGAYTDCHCPRPYQKYKQTIDRIVAQAHAAEEQKQSVLRSDTK